jgi:hypothetical protein
MSPHRYTVYSDEYPLRHFNSEREAKRYARTILSLVENVSVLKRERAYPFRHVERWQVSA